MSWIETVWLAGWNWNELVWIAGANRAGGMEDGSDMNRSETAW